MSWGDPIAITGEIGQEEPSALDSMGRFCGNLDAGRCSRLNGIGACLGGSLVNVSAATISTITRRERNVWSL